MKIFLANLPINMTEDELRGLVTKFGSIKSLYIPRNSGKVRSAIGFVVFNDHNSGVTAIRELHGAEVQGKQIRAEVARDEVQKRAPLTFSEVEIQKLFGHEAAEDEESGRLREYYFKGDAYAQLSADLPLRIVVGHKGIGKSAMFQVAMADDRDNLLLAILIKPTDIVGLVVDESDFLKAIRDWKDGLVKIIAGKVLEHFGAADGDWSDSLKRWGGRITKFLQETFRENRFASLSASEKAIVSSFLDDGRVRVYIDDLDRGWEGRDQDVKRISALLNAVRDISTEQRGIQFRIALRSDVYYLVRTSDESTDKIEGSVVWLAWSNHEIFGFLVKRIETFFGNRVNESDLIRKTPRQLAQSLEKVMEPRFQGRGHWSNAPMYRVLMSLIRKRPRDLVKLCWLAAREARRRRSSLIETPHLLAIFAEYSQGRLQDTYNEYDSELPDIERLLINMRPSKKERSTKQGYVYSTDALIRKIRSIQQTGGFTFASANGRRKATSQELAAFMYKINFLTARKDTPIGPVRAYFEENRYLVSEFVDFGFAWEVHPAYRWALQPQEIYTILDELELDADENELKNLEKRRE